MVKKMTKKMPAPVLAVFLLVFCAAAAFAAEAHLMADSMRYDPATRKIEAKGNVHFSRADGELFGDRGYGDTDGTDFVLEGSVVGSFPAEKTTISCDIMELKAEPGGKKARRVIASGNVVLTRGADKLSSQTLTWEIGSENYRADGKVVGRFESHSIDAERISRNGNGFSAKTVRRYEDRARKLTVSAAELRGTLKKNKVSELEMSGGIVLNMPDKEGKMIRITGDKGLFSEDRGTVVVTGNAAAIQEGRNVHAESLVMHLDTRRMEAIGKSSLAFDMNE